MSNESKSNKKHAHLTLESSCTLRDTEDFHFSLLAADANEKHFMINGGNVERVDTAGLQLLVAFARQLSAAGRTLEWTDLSKELAKCAQRLGLNEVLSIKVSAPSGDAS
jgi:anti-anti-sigma regulatory factor